MDDEIVLKCNVFGFEHFASWQITAWLDVELARAIKSGDLVRIQRIALAEKDLTELSTLLYDQLSPSL